MYLWMYDLDQTRRDQMRWDGRRSYGHEIPQKASYGPDKSHYSLEFVTIGK